MSDDERLLAELGEAVRAGQEVPPGLVAAGREAFAWRNVDAELAALSYDSTTSGALAGTRAQPAALRALTFVTSGLTLEIEVTVDGLLGQVVPAQAGEIELRGQDRSVRAAPVDGVGWFVFRPPPSGMFRLHLRTTGGATVLTEWVRL